MAQSSVNKPDFYHDIVRGDGDLVILQNVAFLYVVFSEPPGTICVDILASLMLQKEEINPTMLVMVF